MLGVKIASVVALLAAPAFGKLTWGSTKYLFVFGDSYTTTGFNISAGVNSPTPGFVSTGRGCDTCPFLCVDFIKRTKLGRVPESVYNLKIIKHYELTFQLQLTRTM